MEIYKGVRDAVLDRVRRSRKSRLFGFATVRWRRLRQTYDSLSKVAFAITGTKWNGPRFFGLRDKEDRSDTAAR